MKVKDIQIDGFGVWTGLSVDSMPDGMTLFYGPNEAGKTTLMQFLRAMFYGFTDERREKYLPPLHGGTPGGAIRVTGPGGGYEIRRHSQLTDSGVTGRLTVTGQDGLTQGQHRLTSLLGQIDEPIFTNVFAIGIRELQELSSLDGTAAADELYKLSSGLDRVSLVDVLRHLRDGRQSIVGSPNSEESSEAKQLLAMLRRRETLRDEVESLTRGGRRWSELALQRRTQSQEIEQLTERLATLERESRTIEVATNVYSTWSQRGEIADEITALQEDNYLPDDAPSQLVQIEAMINERRQKLDEVKQRRRSIRDKAEQLPVSRRLIDLQGRIEAAGEQATWVEAIEEQIQRLDQQIEKAEKQLEIDAQRLGMDEDDRLALLDGDLSHLPDLSKQALSALSGPAKQVKKETFLLKQSRNEASEHKARADKLNAALEETLDRAYATDLQQAIRQHTEMLNTLKHRVQLGEHLEKLKRHYRDLEKETVELTTAEVLPVDRIVLLSVPFIVGGLSLIYGLANVFGFTWLIADPDPTWGMMCILIGVMSLFLYYFGRENGQRATSAEREDAERQIDTLRRQIREVESERNDVDSTLPTSNESLEVRVRETELLLADLEAALPTYHNHEASMQSYRTSRERASKAADRLKQARRSWSATLEQLGLSESLSPSSVRSLSDGYATMQASRQRLDELKAEKDQRRRERQTIAKRIETLYLEALDVEESESRTSMDEDDLAVDLDSEKGTKRFTRRTSPLDQLNHLHEEISRQQHWIKRRRELKEQDVQLKRQQSAHFRAIERGEQQRRALWAKCGVATAEQFYGMIDNNAKLSEREKKHAELDKQVRSIIGSNNDYDHVAYEIEGATETDLEKRWETITTRIGETESRIAQLRTQQGELAQEMKHLADDSRLTTAQLELGCIQRRIESACRRWQTLSMASSLLEDVCGTFERERQPETLREASSFLAQLTDGKYTRIWTPLGTNRLMIDDSDENALSLHLLSRGTKEAVFIALRLALAAAYARRGVMLPLVLDDVLVNFDHDRAKHAAATLKTFAELGHQVMMFTCHQHIVEIFQQINVEVREMPPQGEPGRATIMEWEELLEDEYEEEIYEEEELVEEEPVLEEPEEIIEEPVIVPEPVVEIEVEPEPVDLEPQPAPPKPKPVRQVKRRKPEPVVATVRREPLEQIEYDDDHAEIGWAWFEREPAQRIAEVEDAIASLDDTPRSDEMPIQSEMAPEEVWNPDPSWWNNGQ
ncbi:MAG: AAA family ATPase [Planctomycetota bacterium]